MRHRPLLALAVVLTAIVAVAAFALVYDGAHRTTIAEGVVVGGVDIGGLSRDQATARLHRRLLVPLRRPVTIRHGDRTWHLTTREARVAANVDATVEQALARSRQGNLLQRTWRGVTGGTVDVRLEPRVTYSDAAISRVLRRLHQALDRAPKDATATFGPAGFQTTPSHPGVAVVTSGLHRRIRRALVSPDADRTMVAATRPVQPKVTSGDLADQYGTAIVVDRRSFRLHLYKRMKLVKSYEIGVGMIGRETPAGLYHIQDKAIDPAWTEPDSDWVPKADRGKVVPGGTAQNPLKARWLGIYNGAGIHGVDPSEYGSIGHAASHGCVRMRIADVEDLYPRVPVGTPIYIS